MWSCCSSHYLRQQKFIVSYRPRVAHSPWCSSTIVEIHCVLQTQMSSERWVLIYDSRNSLCLIDLLTLRLITLIYDSRNSLCLIDCYDLYMCTADLRQQKFIVSYRQKRRKVSSSIYDSRNSLCLIDSLQFRTFQETSTIVEIHCVLQTISNYDKVLASTIVEIHCVLQTGGVGDDVGDIYDSRNSLCLIDRMFPTTG